MSRGMRVSARFGQVTRATILPAHELWLTAIEIASALLPPPLKPDLNIGDLPEWIPRSVRLLAKASQLDNDVSGRLLNDERMRDVWTYLSRYRVEDGEKRIRDLGNVYDLRDWNIPKDGIPMSDQLCGAFFLRAFHELSNVQFTASRALVETKARPWADAAKQCRAAANGEPFDTDIEKYNRFLRNALLASADHLQWVADLIEQRGNPRVLPNNTKDPLCRSHVRALTLVTMTLFDAGLHGIVAKTVSVGLNLQPALTREKVEDWAFDLARGKTISANIPHQ